MAQGRDRKALHGKQSSDSARVTIRTFKVPPEGFDPMTAAPRVLRRHGLPNRPEKIKAPEHRAIWDRVFARPLIYIKPTFTRIEGKRHGPLPKARIANVSNSATWSGAVCLSTPATGPFYYIYGEWTVPKPYPRTEDARPYLSSAWIGIDGFQASGDVFQVGTEHMTWALGNAIGVEDVYAWMEWFPDAEYRIDNFPVNPGDSMACLLCADTTPGAATGTSTLVNLHTRVATAFALTAPTGVSLTGNSAEWIFERPSLNGAAQDLPKFGEVYFDSAICGAAGTTLLMPQNGTSLDMVDGAGNVLTETKMIGNQTLKVVDFQ